MTDREAKLGKAGNKLGHTEGRAPEFECVSFLHLFQYSTPHHMSNVKNQKTTTSIFSCLAVFVGRG